MTCQLQVETGFSSNVYSYPMLCSSSSIKLRFLSPTAVPAHCQDHCIVFTYACPDCSNDHQVEWMESFDGETCIAGTLVHLIWGNGMSNSFNIEKFRYQEEAQVELPDPRSIKPTKRQPSFMILFDQMFFACHNQLRSESFLGCLHFV
jgi:hypothetical protein